MVCFILLLYILCITGDYPPSSTTNIKRRELLPSKIFPDKERTRGGFLSTQFLSNESLSSGYSTDQHDDLHTKNQQLGERRDHLLGENTLSKTIKRKVMKSRTQMQGVLFFNILIVSEFL